MSESLDGVSVARTRQNAARLAYGFAAGPCPPPRPRPAAAASAPPRAGAGATNAPAATDSADSIFACGNATDARFSHAVDAAAAGATIGVAAEAGIRRTARPATSRANTIADANFMNVSWSAHSAFNTFIGSTRAARPAGTSAATIAVTSSAAAAPANAVTSVAATPNNRLAIALLTASAATSPHPTAIALVAMVSRTTIASMALALAPSAMRIPISRVRCVTLYAVTPYTPIVDSNQAIAANVASNETLKRGTACAIASSIVRTFDTGSSGSSASISRCTAEDRVSGGASVRTSAYMKDDGNCRYEMYTSGRGCSLSRNSLMSAATPTTVSHRPGASTAHGTSVLANAGRIRLPIGSSPGHN